MRVFFDSRKEILVDIKQSTVVGTACVIIVNFSQQVQDIHTSSFNTYLLRKNNQMKKMNEI